MCALECWPLVTMLSAISCTEKCRLICHMPSSGMQAFYTVLNWLSAPYGTLYWWAGSANQGDVNIGDVGGEAKKTDREREMKRKHWLAHAFTETGQQFVRWNAERDNSILAPYRSLNLEVNAVACKICWRQQHWSRWVIELSAGIISHLKTACKASVSECTRASGWDTDISQPLKQKNQEHLFHKFGAKFSAPQAMTIVSTQDSLDSAWLTRLWSLVNCM